LEGTSPKQRYGASRGFRVWPCGLFGVGVGKDAGVLMITFAEQAEKYLADLATRKRRPVSAASIAAFRGNINRVLPFLAETPLDSITNRAVKEIVNQLVAQKYGSKTIAETVGTIKSVVASLVDDDGNPVVMRTWNSRIIDLPDLGTQRQPSITLEQVNAAIASARSWEEKMLYAILAGTGVRISECLAIRVGQTDNDQSAFLAEDSLIKIRASIYRGEERPGVLKTVNSKRDVDLDPRLTACIARYIETNNILPGQFLFQNRNRQVASLRTLTRRLKARGVSGFHCFRRFRISRCRELGLPEDLLRYAVGHAGADITDRYSKLAENVALRKSWIPRIGLGFDVSLVGAPQPISVKHLRTSKEPEKVLAWMMPFDAADSTHKSKVCR
jgi:integrase